MIVGMLTPAPSIANIIFWQWTNQSYNVAFNYANANKSIEMSNSEIAQSYFAACGTSCTLAVGLSQLLQRRGHVLSAGTRAVVSRIVPFVAVASAGVANVFLMRQKELKCGIMVQDSKGNDLGNSKEAGVKAVSQVAVSRVAVSAACIAMPSVVMSQIEKKSWYIGNPRLRLPVNLVVVCASMLVALPFAIAIFPQVCV